MAVSLRDLKCEELELFCSQTSHFSQKGLLHAHACGRCCLHSRSLEEEGSVVPPLSMLTFTQSPVFTMAPPCIICVWFPWVLTLPGSVSSEINLSLLLSCGAGTTWQSMVGKGSWGSNFSLHGFETNLLKICLTPNPLR